MEISDEGPDAGLVSTRIVSVRKPVTSPVSPVVPSRSSDPRMSQLSPAVSALLVSQDFLLSWPSTQFQAEKTDSPSAMISTNRTVSAMRPGLWRLCDFIFTADAVPAEAPRAAGAEDALLI